MNRKIRSLFLLVGIALALGLGHPATAGADTLTTLMVPVDLVLETPTSALHLFGCGKLIVDVTFPTGPARGTHVTALWDWHDVTATDLTSGVVYHATNNAEYGAQFDTLPPLGFSFADCLKYVAYGSAAPKSVMLNVVAYLMIDQNGVASESSFEVSLGGTGA
jgi:hypothetical protein